MTARRTPRAVGVRTPYSAVPVHVRGWIEQTLGSQVVEYAEQSGGMSPGCATRLVCADGSRAFVKAVGIELNAETPALFRREIAVLGLLGSDPQWADLVAAYDDGSWVAVLLEDVDGDHPDLNDESRMSELLTATDRLVETLAGHPSSSSVPDPRLSDASAALRRYADALGHAADVPEDLMPAWLRASAGTWRERVDALADLPPTQLVHHDIRDDNLLVRRDGALVFLDWGMGRLGVRLDGPAVRPAGASRPALVRRIPPVLTHPGGGR